MKTDLLALRVWLPGLYGWHLLFQDGVPIGCVNNEGMVSIRTSLAQAVSENAEIYILQPDFLKSTPLNKLGVEDIDLTIVDPSISTILTDSVAEKFIPVFYRYFANVFHEGSPFIDSDGDFLPILSRYFPEDPDAICLDLGAGSGYYAHALAQITKKVIACDIAVDRLHHLNDPRIEIVECDIQKLPFSVEVDFSMCNFVLEHVADPYKVISEMIRNLRYGGHILLSFPSFNYRDIIGAKRSNELPTLNFEHLRSFTAERGVHPWEELTDNVLVFLQDRKFDILEVRGVNITTGLSSDEFKAVEPYLDMPIFLSSATPPHNMYGQQTIIYARKG